MMKTGNNEARSFIILSGAAVAIWLTISVIIPLVSLVVIAVLIKTFLF